MGVGTQGPPPNRRARKHGCRPAADHRGHLPETARIGRIRPRDCAGTAGPGQRTSACDRTGRTGVDRAAGFRTGRAGTAAGVGCVRAAADASPVAPGACADRDACVCVGGSRGRGCRGAARRTAAWRAACTSTGAGASACAAVRLGGPRRRQAVLRDRRHRAGLRRRLFPEVTPSSTAGCSPRCEWPSVCSPQLRFSSRAS